MTLLPLLVPVVVYEACDSYDKKTIFLIISFTIKYSDNDGDEIDISEGDINDFNHVLYHYHY